MHSTTDRGTRPPKRVEGSCGRRKNKAALVEVGEPLFVTYCPIHSMDVCKEVARLSYAIRKGLPADRSVLRNLRRKLARVVKRIRPQPRQDAKKLAHKRKIEFTKAKKEWVPKQPKVEPRVPITVVSRKKAVEYSFAAIGSRFESFGFQAYLMACEDAFGFKEGDSFSPAYAGRKKGVREIPLDEDTWLMSSADPVVQYVAKPHTRYGIRTGESLVLKRPEDVARILANREPASFGINHTLRQVADVAESGGFVGSGESLVGKTFVWVDGQPVLVELDDPRGYGGDEFVSHPRRLNFDAHGGR